MPNTLGDNHVRDLAFETLALHGTRTNADKTGALTTPIYQSATFAHLGVGRSTGFDYSRLQNPTRQALEETMATLEGGDDAIAFTTGMAAIACLMELFAPGDHIIASDDLYGGSVRLFSAISGKNGVDVSYVDTSDTGAVRAAIRSNTKALFVETPTNPMMIVSDVAALAEICKKSGCLLIVDNTFLTPYLMKPIALGADIALHSGTKYLGGHNDVLAGFLVTARPELSERLRYLYKTTGACIGPMDAYLVLRGIKTLPVRMDRQQENAMEIARWLKAQTRKADPAVTAVYYPGLDDHPGLELSKRQASGFGAMISFTTKDEALAHGVLERVQVVQFAESLGGIESLITYPTMQTHADVPPEVKEARGITSKLLRLSVGIENIKDLKADLEQAIYGKSLN
ncbi:MAG: PLP-dependent aspartate aminotransferase family protein [Oscillospiraceae bacterium]|jgi:cystathionine beta-lyase/cystathionine gamma-synthase|nr:PLP-dependent aspartate aminotransferase family protein [Oscillospiraceae bacterium]